MYSDDRTTQIILALLKKYNIKKIVVSPGGTNLPVARSVQTDSFFEVYSVVDERSAAYFAAGLAFESGEPVVISCTGATASRNYLSALTEAYYRGLPIIALTSQGNTNNDYGSLSPQMTNRTVSQLDVKRHSVDLSLIKDEEVCMLYANKALTMATKRGGGPVHINIFFNTVACNTPSLPDVIKIDYYQTDDLLYDDCLMQIKNQLYGKKIGLFIGSHRKFSQKEREAIEYFINAYDVAVFYDHTSNYHWKNKVLISVASDLRNIKNRPDLVIDIGGVSGEYSAPKLLGGQEFWRISEDGEFHRRYGNLRKQFDCPEYLFFNALADKQTASASKYYSSIMQEIDKIIIPDLPLSNTLISSQMAKKLPKGSSLHLAILNSLRNMNFFELDESIDSSCNVGGFGIDGAVSTLVGQSMANKNRLYFGQVGDLAFFYDMNALGIRHISNNVRLLLVNNGRGIEFRVNPSFEEPFGEELDQFIAAAGHHGSAKAWALSMNFEYLTANNKDEFLAQIDKFCSPDIDEFDKPVLFEVFTTVKDEQDGLSLIREANRPKIDNPNKDDFSKKVKSVVKQVLPQKAIDAIKKLKEK
jgi:2-succinyl-5-enolpyruvyl-6-hydroxy-3-cyclohexene-1-carboxylate synthase